MSLLLTRLQTRTGANFEVVLVSTPEEREAVARLRYQIYVHEMGLLDDEHPYVQDERFEDPYDAWSTTLLLLVDGEPGGTVRVTECLDGELELEEFTRFRHLLPEGSRPAELTRYMVRSSLRGTRAGPLLLYGAFRVITEGRCTHLVAAAKMGSLSRYYRNAGLELLSDEGFVYGLTGCTYQVGAMHFGGPGSFRRRRWKLWIGSLRWLTSHFEAVHNLMFRRHTGARPVVVERPACAGGEA